MKYEVSNLTVVSTVANEVYVKKEVTKREYLRI